MANKSKTYLLPYMHDYIDIKFVDRLQNTYIFYEHEYRFCLQYEFSGKKEFTDYETALMQNERFVEAVDISKTQVLYVFEFPDELLPVVEMFIEGKYSYLPRKEKIKGFLMEKFHLETSHRIFHILDRSEELREAMEDSLGVRIDKKTDLIDPPSIETEEFNIDRI